MYDAINQLKRLQARNLDAERVYGVYLGLCIIASIIFLFSIPHLILLSSGFGILMLVLIGLNRYLTIRKLQYIAPAPSLIQNLFPFLFKNE